MGRELRPKSDSDELLGYRVCIEFWPGLLMAMEGFGY